jgi:transposase
MEVLHRRCCGMDVHKRTVAACLKTRGKTEIRTYETTTDELRAMALWLKEAGCTHVAMESTGVYWKPVYNILELSGMEIEVVNARHIKAVPGRKTDVKDAEWICDLARHGLVRASFIPDRTQRELQELMRYRRSLIGERSREVNRIQKVLEGANIKLSSMVSDVMGVSARAMLEALAKGETDPDIVMTEVHTKLKATPDELRKSLAGFMGQHQQLMLTTQLAHIDLLNQKLADVDAEVGRRMSPYETIVVRLDTITGVGRITAQEILAAIGTDMSRFPTARHLASWAKICPANHESAGKRRSVKTGRGNPFLRATLVEAAKAASKSKNTYLRSRYYRLLRRGPNKATIAVAHSILTAAYYVIRDGVEYRELGPSHLDQTDVRATTRRLVRRIQKLGFTVTIAPAA